MKSKSLVIALSMIPLFTIHACHQINFSFQEDKICEDVTGLNLTDQFSAGILQQKIIFREIDPHTLIHKAILENAPEVIDFLLRQGVSVDYPNENGMSPLTIAILNRSNYAVQVLLDHGANPNPLIKWNNMTLLGLALNMRDSTTARLLFDHGAKPTTQDFSKICRLWSQARLNDGNDFSHKPYWLNFIEDIIKREKIDVNAFDYPSNSPVYIAAENFPKFYHPQTGDFENSNSLLKLLIDNGADINSKKLGLKAPLYVAINQNNLNLIKFLIDNGADVNLQAEGMSPLQMALFRNPEIVQYLLQHGARS